MKEECLIVWPTPFSNILFACAKSVSSISENLMKLLSSPSAMKKAECQIYQLGVSSLTPPHHPEHQTVF